MSKNIIRDGYTRPGYVAADEGFNEAVEFTYRPMIPEQSGVFVSAAYKDLPPARQAMAAATAIAKQLVCWSEVDDKGTPVQISVENVRRLPWYVFNALLNIIAGFRASDPRPEVKQKLEQEEDGDRLLQSLGTGEAIGSIADQADLKN